MSSIQRTKERRQRRLYAAIAGWALLGAASTGIVACSTAADAETTPTSAVASSDVTSSAAPGSSSSAASSGSASSGSASSSSASSSSQPSASSTAPAATSEAAAATPAVAASTYADGIYTASGSYSSPGGTESITITLTLAGDVITDATAVGDAAGPPSSQYQEQFVDNFASLIVGKDIDEVSLDKVAGSSLTSGGFNAAVESIRSDALA